MTFDDKLYSTFAIPSLDLLLTINIAQTFNGLRFHELIHYNGVKLIYGSGGIHSCVVNRSVIVVRVA
jgi:hypothetical protein